jgi:hypothetical protein
MPVLSGQCCCSRWGHLIAELPRGNHSREAGSIATACLARSSSPLSYSHFNGDFPVPAE